MSWWWWQLCGCRVMVKEMIQDGCIKNWEIVLEVYRWLSITWDIQDIKGNFTEISIGILVEDQFILRTDTRLKKNVVIKKIFWFSINLDLLWSINLIWDHRILHLRLMKFKWPSLLWQSHELSFYFMFITILFICFKLQGKHLFTILTRLNTPFS